VLKEGVQRASQIYRKDVSVDSFRLTDISEMVLGVSDIYPIEYFFSALCM
jgi:hypothetical protein